MNDFTFRAAASLSLSSHTIEICRGHAAEAKCGVSTRCAAGQRSSGRGQAAERERAQREGAAGGAAADHVADDHARRGQHADFDPEMPDCRAARRPRVQTALRVSQTGRARQAGLWAARRGGGRAVGGRRAPRGAATAPEAEAEQCAAAPAGRTDGARSGVRTVDERGVADDLWRLGAGGDALLGIPRRLAGRHRARWPSTEVAQARAQRAGRQGGCRAVRADDSVWPCCAAPGALLGVLEAASRARGGVPVPLGPSAAVSAAPQPTLGSRNTAAHPPKKPGSRFRLCSHPSLAPARAAVFFPFFAEFPDKIQDRPLPGATAAPALPPSNSFGFP